MTPEIEEAFCAVKREFGNESLSRVEEMVYGRHHGRHPLQGGARWILPGISQQPWHEPLEYPDLAPLVRELEGAHALIKQEHRAAWECRREQFSDYEHYLTRQEDWQALYLFRRGTLVSESAAAAPTAYRIVRDVAVATELLCPLLECHYSTLLPGAAVRPHCDLWNFSINLHLAIDIPDECGLTVAGEARAWEEGHCLLFDYSFEHDAWNAACRPRTCLLMDLWHPETTRAERKALTALIIEIRRLMGEA